jgi:hypothetical protein
MSKVSLPYNSRLFTRSRVLMSAAVVIAAGAMLWAAQATIHASAKLPLNPSHGMQAGAKRPIPVLPYVYTRSANPAQTIVTDQKGVWLATFTDKAYTVRLAGAQRTFAETSTTKATVTHNTWVRVLPKPFTGTVDDAWLTMELADTSPDILATAMQYISKAPAVTSDGIQIAGDASYGPLQSDGSRQEGADFNDFLGVDWHYGQKIDHPEVAQAKSLDCSGYMRMVWGYRAGLPLASSAASTTSLTGSTDALSRRAVQMQNASPGIELRTDNGSQVTDFHGLSVGDVVFFDASHADGTQIDHVGIFMGSDSEGHYRFISSRKTANGPTLGDVGGKSILDGSGHYAKAYRAARKF